MSLPISVAGVQRARALVRPQPVYSADPLDPARVAGRVVEVSEPGAFGALSLAVGLVRACQDRGEPAAWIEAGPTVFFPPDLAHRGIDVEALPVLFLPETAGALGAAEALVRSGAFGLVVVDGVGGRADEASLGRLGRLAEDRQTAVVLLTRKGPGEPSLGTQVSLRVGVGPGAPGEAEVTVLKDKRSGPPSRLRRRLRGPLGLY